MKIRVTTTEIFDLEAVQKEIDEHGDPREMKVWNRFMKELKQKGWWQFFNRKPKSELERVVRNRFKILLELNMTWKSVDTEYED